MNLQPLYDVKDRLEYALTTTGGGRLEVVQSAWKNHPEYFTDHRVLSLLIQDLGDKYTYLADFNVKILVALGPSVIPLLKEGFDPAGKSDMVRRVDAIEKIAGAGENEFYRAMLPKAKRNVKLTLIWALRHDPANGPELVELCRTKKGEVQEMAYRALVRSNSVEAQEFFEALAVKDPDQTLKHLRWVVSEDGWASRLTARLFLAELEQVQHDPSLPLTEDTKERYRLLLAALCDKRGKAVCDVFRRGAEMGKLLERLMEDSQLPMAFYLSYGLRQVAADWKNFRPQLAQVLEGLLMRRPDSDLCSLALELYGRHGELWLPAALLAQLYTLDSAACYDWGAAQFFDEGQVRKEAVSAYNRVFNDVKWSTQRERYEISPLWNYGDDVPFITPIEPLDPRWFDLIAQGGKNMRHLLTTLNYGGYTI